MRLELGVDQTVSILLDNKYSMPHLFFREEKVLKHQCNNLTLTTEESRSFLESIPNVAKKMTAILAGDWEMNEKLDLSDKS